MKHFKLTSLFRSIIILLIGLTVGIFLSKYYQIIKEKLAPTNPTKILTFKSKRVPFSFIYPNDFPITPLSDQFVYQFDNRIESINFGTSDGAPNAGGSGEAVLIVERFPIQGSKEPEELILQPIKEQIANMNKDYPKMKLQMPTLEKTYIGNSEAFHLIYGDKNLTNTFNKQEDKYFVVRKGLLYTIVITPHNQDKSIQMQKILKTFNFEY